MKVGDLVTLSSRGKKQDQNRVTRTAKFGMIMEIRDNDGTRHTSTDNCTKPLIRVKWHYPEGAHIGRYSEYYHHWRYEIKKLKAQSKQ